MATWNSNNIVWSDNNPNFLWNNVYEVTVEATTIEIPVSPRGAVFYKKEQKEYKKWPKEEKKYIKILCVINDENFEDVKYINKKLKIQSFDEELTIRDIKKVNISEGSVKYEMINTNNEKELIFKIEDKKEINKITVKIKKIEKNDFIHR